MQLPRHLPQLFLQPDRKTDAYDFTGGFSFHGATSITLYHNASSPRFLAFPFRRNFPPPRFRPLFCCGSRPPPESLGQTPPPLPHAGSAENAPRILRRRLLEGLLLLADAGPPRPQSSLPIRTNSFAKLVTRKRHRFRENFMDLFRMGMGRHRADAPHDLVVAESGLKAFPGQRRPPGRRERIREADSRLPSTSSYPTSTFMSSRPRCSLAVFLQESFA